MERKPTESTLKCIGHECVETPTIVLIGQHERPNYQIQIMTCEADLPRARQFAQKNYPRVGFREVQHPEWLKRAQAQEIATRAN